MSKSLVTSEVQEELRRAGAELNQAEISERKDNRSKKKAAYLAAYRKANKEKIADYQAAYREANKENAADDGTIRRESE